MLVFRKSLLQLAEMGTCFPSDYDSWIASAAKVCIDAFQQGNKILACGNGGSAAQASHFAAELVGRFENRWLWMPAISLVADGPLMTALANDSQYANIFAHQVRALGNEGDVLVAFSTSGQSMNILHALKEARVHGLKTILLTGERGLDMDRTADVCLAVPSKNTQRIQEMHLLILHVIAEEIAAYFEQE